MSIQNLNLRLNRAETARFMRNTTVVGECLLWTGPTFPNGYGKFRRGPGQPEKAAHRIAWENFTNTPVPDGMQLGHTCHDEALERGECDGGPGCPHRSCVNPMHLEPQSPSQNTLLSNHAQRRKPHCPQGHEYTEENTIRRDGRRWCRTCESARTARRRGGTP